MIATITSATLQGVRGILVQVEVDLARSLPQFTTVGLAGSAVKESKDRVRAAIKNAGFKFPPRRITVNLAPADVPKVGTAFDLPMAVGILAVTGDVAEEALSDFVLAGELSLDGHLRPVRGALPLAMAAREGGKRGIILPLANTQEAVVVQGIEVYGARTLKEVVDFLNGEEGLTPATGEAPKPWTPSRGGGVDLRDVAGQRHAKRALEVAAAGGHNLLMIGPPGSGKSMLARRLTTILPSMSFEERLETTLVYSVQGMVPAGASLVEARPFRAPHHTISEAGLVGGGPGPSPGEVSLAHHGVLFLDELPEFKRSSLEVLRQPLEDGEVTLARARGVLTFPARFMLVATMNPCPCGYLGDQRRRCICSAQGVERYKSRLSGPLLDRIDMHVEVPALPFSDLKTAGQAEASVDVRGRVEAARVRQAERFRAEDCPGMHCNAQLSPRHLRALCQPDAEGQRLLERAVESLGLSARAYARILKVARTLADLEGVEDICVPHVAEAIQYRVLDREKRSPMGRGGPRGASPSEGAAAAAGR